MLVKQDKEMLPNQIIIHKGLPSKLWRPYLLDIVQNVKLFNSGNFSNLQNLPKYQVLNFMRIHMIKREILWKTGKTSWMYNWLNCIERWWLQQTLQDKLGKGELTTDLINYFSLPLTHLREKCKFVENNIKCISFWSMENKLSRKNKYMNPKYSYF